METGQDNGRFLSHQLDEVAGRGQEGEDAGNKKKKTKNTLFYLTQLVFKDVKTNIVFGFFKEKTHMWTKIERFIDRQTEGHKGK